MSAADLLEDSFPHATPAGYTLGCRGGHCPGREQHGMSCSEARTRYHGDWAFRRLVEQGATAVELGEFVAAQRAAEAASDRAGSVVARKPAPALRRKRVPKTGITRKRYTSAEMDRIRELNALGWNDTRIGAELGRPANSVRDRRVEMGLPTRPRVYARRGAA